MKSTFFNALRSVAYIVTFGILAVATTGCNSSEKGKDKTLSVSDKSVIIDAEGGSQKVLVSAEGLNWIASASDSWVKVTPESGTGDSYLMITADANPSADIRTAVVTIEAPGVKGVSITVLQNEGKGGDSSTFDPQAVMLTYYGDFFETSSKTCVVVMNILSKDLNSDYQIEYPYTAIQLVLNVPYSDDYQTAISSVFGHTFTGSSNYGEYTIDLETSAFGNAKSGTETSATAISSATVTVSSLSSTSANVTVSYDVKLEDGSSLSGSYTGSSVYFGDNSGSDDTTLTGDVRPEITSASATIYYNLPVSGEVIKDFSLCDLTLEGNVTSNKTKEAIAVSLYMEYNAASNKELSVGTYTVAPSDAESWSDFKYTFDAGEIEDNSFYPSYYAQMVYESNDWYISDTYALVTDGTIVISKSDDKYSFDVNFTDSKGNKITYNGTLSVPITVRNANSSTKSISSVLSASAKKIERNDFRINPAVKFTKIK